VLIARTMSKKAQKKTQAAAAKEEAPAPAPAAAADDEGWTLVTTKKRNKKKNKKVEEPEPEQHNQRHPGAAGGFGGRPGQGQHGRDFRNRRPHVPEEVVPVEHSKDVVKVVLFVTNEEEEEALRKALEGRPFEVAAVAALEGSIHYENKEKLEKVRILAGLEAVRAFMKELSIGIFVMPVDDSRYPEPRMSDEVSAVLDVAVRAGAYVMTVPVAPVPSKGADKRMFFAAVPTHESQQQLVNILGVVADDEVRQDFEMHGFDIPEKAGLFDIYTSLMNSAVKKYKVCGDAEILPNGDQFVQDIASQTKKAVHYPVFTVSFRVGKLEHYTSHQSKRVIYEIHSDDVIPDTLKNIFILLGVPIRQKLTIIVSKYQGEVKPTSEDPEKKLDVEFEKIMYSYSSLTESPVFELYLPRYVDPDAVAAAPAPAPAAEPAAAPEPEAASK